MATTFSETAARRLLTLTLLPVVTAVLLMLAPLACPVLGFVDVVRRRESAYARTYLLVAAYGAAECIAVAAAIGYRALAFVGAIDRPTLERRLVDVQSAWTRGLFDVGRRLFRLSLDVDEGGALGPRPAIILMRHSSIGDTMLPSLLVTQPHGVRLRYVLKRELLWDPALDVVGNVLPNYFVDRQATGTDREREGVRALTVGLRPDEGVLLYPEGTVYDDARRAAAIARIASRGDAAALERALRLRHVLPIRLGGALELLRANPGLDVVVSAHTGFEGAVGFRTLCAGGWLDQTIRVRFRRVPYAELPTDDAARIEFLLSAWERIDEQVGELHALDAASFARRLGSHMESEPDLSQPRTPA